MEYCKVWHQFLAWNFPIFQKCVWGTKNFCQTEPPFHQELAQNDNVIQTAQGPVGYNRSCWPDNCGPGRGPWQDRQAALPPGVTTRRFKASTKCSNFFFLGGPKVSTLHQIVAKTSPGICGHPIYVLWWHRWYSQKCLPRGSSTMACQHLRGIGGTEPGRHHKAIYQGRVLRGLGDLQKTKPGPNGGWTGICWAWNTQLSGDYNKSRGWFLKLFWLFPSQILEEMIQFDEHILLKWVESTI